MLNAFQEIILAAALSTNVLDILAHPDVRKYCFLRKASKIRQLVDFGPHRPDAMAPRIGIPRFSDQDTQFCIRGRLIVHSQQMT